MNSCQGPCLKHCYAKNNIVFIFSLGIIGGYLITKFLKSDNKK